MTIFRENTGLYTDYYELTMAQGYFLAGKQTVQTSFDYFFRRNPSNYSFYADGIELEAVDAPKAIYHIQQPEIKSELDGLDYEEIIRKVVENGKVISNEQSPETISVFAKERLAKLP